MVCAVAIVDFRWGYWCVEDGRKGEGCDEGTRRERKRDEGGELKKNKKSSFLICRRGPRSPSLAVYECYVDNNMCLGCAPGVQRERCRLGKGTQFRTLDFIRQRALGRLYPFPYQTSNDLMTVSEALVITRNQSVSSSLYPEPNSLSKPT